MATQPELELFQITDGSKTAIITAASTSTDKTVIKPCGITINSINDSDVDVVLYIDNGTLENKVVTAELNSTNGHEWVSTMLLQWTDSTTVVKADPSASVEVHVTVSYTRQT